MNDERTTAMVLSSHMAWLRHRRAVMLIQRSMLRKVQCKKKLKLGMQTRHLQ
jgi:hypothetical protein